MAGSPFSFESSVLRPFVSGFSLKRCVFMENARGHESGAKLGLVFPIGLVRVWKKQAETNKRPTCLFGLVQGVGFEPTNAYAIGS